MRRENSHECELVSQLLYGDCFIILSEKNEWLQIKSLDDSYTGWVNNNQVKEISKINAEKITFDDKIFSTRLIDYIETDENKLSSIVLGSNIGACKYFGHKYDNPKNKKTNTKQNLIKVASLYLNSPYLWGGKTPFGIDCSGLTQMIYRINGYRIPRDANQQSEFGDTLSFIDESEPGDLAFFDDKEGKITHVGMLLENNYILHAHGRVRIDGIDQTGIFNMEKQKHSHKLRIIKKII